MAELYFEIHSVPDRSFPVAQVYCGAIMVAEVSREDGENSLLQVCNIPAIEIDMDMATYIQTLHRAEESLVEAIRTRSWRNYSPG
jgi:hypothetical protein